MGTLGGYMMLFGIGSIVLNMLEREFVILMWIDSWGTEVGWSIRIGMIVFGAILIGMQAMSARGDGEAQSVNNQNE